MGPKCFTLADMLLKFKLKRELILDLARVDPMLGLRNDKRFVECVGCR